MCVGAFSSPSSTCCQAQSAGDDPFQRRLEVARDGGIGVLVDGHACRRVRTYTSTAAPRWPPTASRDAPRDVDELALPLGANAKLPHRG